MTPSPDWQVLLAGFRPLFTRPGYRYFCAFVLVFAHLDRRLLVTQVILARGLSRHFTSYYRFLRAGAWSLAAVRQQLWAACWEPCLAAGGRLFLALDDTVCAKGGRRFTGLGWHHDPMNRQHPRRLSHGHCWVCLAALAEQGRGHWVALFLGAALYVQEKACQQGQPFATKLKLAAGLLLELGPPRGVSLYAVVDGAYARRDFVQPVRAAGRHVISRLRKDTVFYDLPPARRKGTKGRPRKYGTKQAARDWAAGERGWQAVTLRLYGRDTTVQLKTRVVLQRTLGVKIRLVAVRWGKRPLVFLFATDPALAPAAIVRAYCARFAIETGFRDAKQSFGLATYQVRGAVSVERLVHLCLWAQTLLRLRMWAAPAEPLFGAWRRPLEYLTLAQQKQQSQAAAPVFAASTPSHTPTEKEAVLPWAA
jgi:hypothetical protein